MSPLNSNSFFFWLIFQLFSQNQNNINNMSTIKVHKVQINAQFFFFSIYALSIFLKMFVFFSSFSFYAVFKSVQVSFLLFPFFCLFPLSCRPLFFIYFFNLISPSLCLYLNIVTMGLCTPFIQFLTSISTKQAWFVNQTFSIIFFLLFLIQPEFQVSETSAHILQHMETQNTNIVKFTCSILQQNQSFSQCKITILSFFLCSFPWPHARLS